MRVLAVGSLYPPHSLGGYERAWQVAMAALRERGHDVTVLCTDHREPSAGGRPDEPGVHRELRWYWRDHAFPRLGPLEMLRLERANREALARRLDAGVDLVQWWAMGGMGLSLIDQVDRRGLPSQAFVHDAWPAYGPRVDRWTALWGRTPRAVAAAGAALSRIPTRYGPDAVGHWSFNSDFMRAHAVRRGAVPAGASCSVEPPGVDGARFPRSEPAPWSGRLLVVGRVEPRKGVATAIRALARVRDAHLTVAGPADPEHLAELQALIAELGLGDRVELAGPVDPGAVAATYAAADAVLFPVEWDEPWGLVPLEAMSVGRPVVATGTGGSAEYLRDGVNCLLAAPGDPVALAAAITRLAGDAALRTSLVGEGAATAAAHDERGFGAAIAAITERGAG